MKELAQEIADIKDPTTLLGEGRLSKKIHEYLHRLLEYEVFDHKSLVYILETIVTFLPLFTDSLPVKWIIDRVLSKYDTLLTEIICEIKIDDTEKFYKDVILPKLTHLKGEIENTEWWLNKMAWFASYLKFNI